MPMPGVEARASRSRDVGTYPQSTFNPMSGEAPWPSDIMSTLHDKDPSAPFLSAENWRLHGVAWQAALATKGAWNELDDCWANLLPEVGILLRGPPDVCGLVVHVSKFCVLVQTCRVFDELSVAFSQLAFNDTVGGQLPIRPVFLKEPLSNWTVVHVKPVPPGDARCLRAEGVHLRVATCGEPMLLLLFASRRGFKNLTVKYLKQAWCTLKLTGPKPKTRLGYVTKLMQHVERGLSDEAVKERLAAADDEQDELASGSVEPSALGVLFDDEDDQDLAREVTVMETFVEQRRARIRHRRQSAAAGGGAPPQPPAPLPASSRTIIRDRQNWNQPAAKAYLPPGAKITMHKAGGRRWTLTCDAFVGSKDRTIGFGEAGANTPYTALCQLLAKAWKATCDATDTTCPWIIPGTIFG